MHSSQFGITFTDSRGPVNSDGPIHCIRSLNRMVRYSVMPLPVMAAFSSSVNGLFLLDRCVLGSIGKERALASSRPKHRSMVSIYDFWQMERVRVARSRLIARPRSHEMDPRSVIS